MYIFTTERIKTSLANTAIQTADKIRHTFNVANTIKVAECIIGRVITTVHTVINYLYMGGNVSKYLINSFMWIYKRPLLFWRVKSGKDNTVELARPMNCGCFSWQAVCIAEDTKMRLARVWHQVNLDNMQKL